MIYQTTEKVAFRYTILVLSEAKILTKELALQRTISLNA